MSSRQRLFHNVRPPAPSSAPVTPTALHMSLNINGLNKQIKQSQLNTMRKFHNWKVLYLSDTRIYKAEEIPKLEKYLGVVSGSWSLGTPHCAGTAVLFFMPVNIVSCYNDPEGRFTRVDYVWEDEEYSSISVYAPAVPRVRQSFFENDLAQFFSEKPLLGKSFIGGDWNFVSDPSLDRRSSNTSGGQIGCAEFQELSMLHNLSDLYRHYHPRSKSFTFSSLQHNMSTRIDRCYVTKDALAFTSDCKHLPLPSSISDHEAGVAFTVRAINACSRGPSYWKLNASLLKRPGFIKIMESTIADFVNAKDSYPDVRSWWEGLKLAIRLVSEPYAKEQARRRKATVNSLEKQLQQVNEDLCVSPHDPSLPSKKEKLSSSLAKYYQDVHAAARLKAGVKHSLEGEKPTAYFSSLIKARAQKSMITEVVSSDGTHISDIGAILTEATNFYARLYQAKSTAKGLPQQSFLNALSSRLTEDDKLLCDRNVAKEELLSSLKKLSNGKAPGIDGIPVEFYKSFWSKLGDSFMELLEECYRTKELPLTMRTSVITLIYKKADRKDLKNYRPISLLCADYKIIAKLFAERMKSVLHKVVHHDQTGFVPGRYIGDNIITFLEVQDYLHRNQLPGFAFLADIEKAFDSVCREFLVASLSKMNFGDFFISWFLTLHNKFTAKLIINGFLSESFDIHSGVRQGCPWAPLLFLAATEPLACNLRSSGIGIKIQNISFIYKGYADDTCCYLSDAAEVVDMLAVFSSYRAVSGLKLNELKSALIPLGKSVGMDRPANITCKWLSPGDHEPVLGIQVGCSYDDDLSWKAMLQKFYKSIKQWIPKHLSVFGRISAAKSYIASKSWYLASVVPPKSKFVAKINSLLWNFIQNDSCLNEEASTNRYFSRWSSQTLRQSKPDGGLNAQQYGFQLAAIHCKWVYTLLNPTFIASWKALAFSSLLETGVGSSIFIAHKSILTLKSIPPRWKLYLEAWFAEGLIVNPPPMDFECLLNEPLWFNRFITKENGSSFGHYLTHDKIISNNGPRFIADVVAKSTYSSELHFMNRDSLRAKYDAATAKILAELIDCIPTPWRVIVRRKTREKFIENEWIVQRKAVHNFQRPSHVYRIIECLPGKLRVVQYNINPINLEIMQTASSDELQPLTLSKAHVVKAVVMELTKHKKSANLLIYNGSYQDGSLMLSRIQWTTRTSTVQFPAFSINMRYRSILETNCMEVTSKAKWEMIFATDLDWPAIYKYLHDPILHNRTKEFLYKIYTRACMVGTRV